MAQGVKAIAAGIGHVLALKTDGTLWAWGSNGEGQLGNGTFNRNRNPNPTQIAINDVQSIYAGYNISFAIKNDGSLWGWGENEALILNKDNNVFRYTSPKQIMDSGVASVALGSQHILVLKTDGSLWGWGYVSLLGDPSVGIEFLKFPRKTSLDKAAIPTISISDKNYDYEYLLYASTADTSSGTQKLLGLYVDHSLIYVSIGGDRTEATYQKICKWFKKGHPNAGKGTFSLEGSQFIGLSSNVQSNILIDFQGELKNHQLFIKTQSSNGAKSEYIFEYIGSVDKDGNVTFGDRNNFVDG